jgi:hypothetical protein
MESRHDNNASEFVVIVLFPDGTQAERFTDGDSYDAWLERFERDLGEQHWMRHADGPAFLPYGWPMKRLT